MGRRNRKASTSHKQTAGRSHAAHKEYVHRPRRDKGLIRLKPRDLAALRWVGEQYAVRLDILQRLLGRGAQQATAVAGQVGDSSARRVVRRWQQARLVQARKFFFASPEWIWLTRHGLRQLHLPFRFWAPTVGALPHLHQINAVRLLLEEQAEVSLAWQSERRLRQVQPQPAGLHLPDGEAHLANGEVVAVEVERTPKSRRRLAQILDRLGARYSGVWFFVTPQSRRAVAAAIGVQHVRFHLYPLAQVPLAEGEP